MGIRGFYLPGKPNTIAAPTLKNVANPQLTQLVLYLIMFIIHILDFLKVALSIQIMGRLPCAGCLFDFALVDTVPHPRTILA
jgi:hypothetical protein